MSKQKLPIITTRDQVIDLIVNKKRDQVKRDRLRQVTLRDLKIGEVLDGRLTEYQMYQFNDRRWNTGPLGNKTPFADLMENGAWKGRRCFIIGGGPSLHDFDFDILSDELVIGTNRAFEFFSNPFNPTINVAMDGRFYHWIMKAAKENHYNGKVTRKKFDNFQGVKLWIDISNHMIDEVFYIRGIKRQGLTTDLKQGIFYGNNTGFGALSLAIVLGASPIYLLGYDMKHRKVNGKIRSHFHSGHPNPQAEKGIRMFVRCFEKLAPVLAKKGIQVININTRQGTDLNCFKLSNLPEDIPGPKKPIFISFYTQNTGYKQEARYLRRSLWKFSLPHDIQEVPNRGSWLLNTSFKAEFILGMMDKYPGRPLIWVDCDAAIKKYPDHFYNGAINPKCTMAMHFRIKRDSKKELLSGTMYISNNKLARDIVKKWIQLNQQNPNKWEQRNLHAVINSYLGKENGLWIESLPPEYCKIYDLMKAEGGAPVIEHYQASRKYRRLLQ